MLLERTGTLKSIEGVINLVFRIVGRVINFRIMFYKNINYIKIATYRNIAGINII